MRGFLRTEKASETGMQGSYKITSTDVVVEVPDHTSFELGLVIQVEVAEPNTALYEAYVAKSYPLFEVPGIHESGVEVLEFPYSLPGLLPVGAKLKIKLV